jgi:ABC-type Mn2+/Zn2+ transport system permease subunit
VQLLFLQRGRYSAFEVRGATLLGLRTRISLLLLLLLVVVVVVVVVAAFGLLGNSLSAM